MCIHAAYPIDVKERVLPRSASQSPTARRVQFVVPSRSSSASHDDSGSSRSVSAQRGWSNGEGDVSRRLDHCRPHGEWRSFEDRSRMSGRGHGKERQMDYGRVNTSFGRYFGACYVCHRHGHFAHERPENRRDGRQSCGSDQRHQSRDSMVVKFSRWAGRDSVSRTTRRLSDKSVSKTVHPFLSTLWR